MTAAAGALQGVRVLDLSGEPGQFCGKLLGDCGADVIKDVVYGDELGVAERAPWHDAGGDRTTQDGWRGGGG
jgi:crotonobetainyl-CoA:carnitine CoA-transferase CaiB-like acyl-CoA transferase